jgi:hypothetical protein
VQSSPRQPRTPLACELGTTAAWPPAKPSRPEALLEASTSLVNPQSNSVGFNREAFYFSDDFRLTRTITMNLGLRYEIEPAILVDSNNAANFDPTQPTGMVQQNGSPPYHTDYHDFAPRAGFAWDLSGRGTTVLRAGMGVSYDPAG